MHTRQSGAAHVNIFFFLVMLVLFLGALGFAYVTLERNKDLEAKIAQTETRLANSTIGQLADQNANLQIYRHYVEDIAKVVGEVGEYKGRDGFNYMSGDTKVDPTPIQNASLPNLVKQAIRDFAQQVKVNDSDGLSTFFGYIKNATDALERQVRDLEAQRTAQASEIAQLQASLAKMTSDRAREVQGLNAQLTQKTDEHQSAIDTKDNLLRTGNAQYSKLREEKSAEAEEHARVQLQLRKEANNLTARIDAATEKTKMINPASMPDGAVIDASDATGLAWINLGRRDLLQPGISFEIVSPDKLELKAHGTVRRVEEARAEIQVSGLKDRYNPIVKGDLVRNDLYSPSLRHNVYLMGRFSEPYTRPMVKAMLERLGNKVADKVGPGVDLIILGADSINEEGSGFTPLSETDEYKEAQFLRIEMVPLQKVRGFLKLADS